MFLHRNRNRHFNPATTVSTTSAAPAPNSKEAFEDRVHQFDFLASEGNAVAAWEFYLPALQEHHWQSRQLQALSDRMAQGSKPGIRRSDVEG